MDYKTKLQTNNANLENNNIDLQSILNTINALPEASDSTGTNTSDATITSGAQLLKDVTAYGANGKVIGTMEVHTYYVGNSAPSNSFGNDGDLFLVRAGE